MLKHTLIRTSQGINFEITKRDKISVATNFTEVHLIRYLLIRSLLTYKITESNVVFCKLINVN